MGAGAGQRAEIIIADDTGKAKRRSQASRWVGAGAACMLEKGRQATADFKVRASGMHGRRPPAGGEGQPARARVSKMDIADVVR